jgi:DNA-binding transcriptional ArsR family regulator
MHSHRESGMLRLHFTSDDLARVRIVPAPDVLWETVLSATLLAGRQGAAVFDPWRARTRSRVRLLCPAHVSLIRYLARPIGNFPDFLTPSDTVDDLEAGIEKVLMTPRTQLRREVASLGGQSPWIRPLLDGDKTAVEAVGDALRRYHQAAVAPYWSRIRALVDADRAVRARAVLDGGVEGLLSSLRPVLQWHSPVLTAHYPVDHDVYLNGRGLVLVPSAFCWQDPITLIDPELPPVLVYPAIGQQPGWWTDAPAAQGSRSLINVLGETRAAVLSVIEDGCTTTELARRVGVSPPSASRHAATLREAGLVTSLRQRNLVIHTLTPLGHALIRATSTGAR